MKVPAKVINVRKKSETFEVSELDGTVKVLVEVNHESGKVTIKKPTGDFQYVFKDSAPETAVRVIELMMCAARHGEHILRQCGAHEVIPQEEKKK